MRDVLFSPDVFYFGFYPSNWSNVPGVAVPKPPPENVLIVHSPQSAFS